MIEDSARGRIAAGARWMVLTLPLLVGMAPCVVGADQESDPAAPSGLVSASDSYNRDSNPQFTIKRYSPANQFPADWFNEAVARGHLTLPSIPVTISGRVSDDEYLHQHELSSVTTSGSIAIPLEIGADTHLEPSYRREDQWYDGTYFQARNEAEASWSQTWTTAVSSEVRPFYGVLTHPTHFHDQDGDEYGMAVELGLTPPTSTWLQEISLSLTPDRYTAQNTYEGYHQLDVGLVLSYLLPAGVRALVSADVIPTVYNATEPGRHDIRRDRTETVDAVLSRHVGEKGGRWYALSAEATCTVTRNHSSIVQYSYDEVIVGLGLKYTWRR